MLDLGKDGNQYQQSLFGCLFDDAFWRSKPCDRRQGSLYSNRPDGTCFDDLLLLLLLLLCTGLRNERA